MQAGDYLELATPKVVAGHFGHGRSEHALLPCNEQGSMAVLPQLAIERGFGK
jgi:hypothetical protein